MGCVAFFVYKGKRGIDRWNDPLGRSWMMYNNVQTYICIIQ